mmetsp:Transcript_49527/g.105940  ORF Transcript_49527/g.105940 Transcript_49527/m.105940 type:complete len:242 (+) Transcript_49527:942-1667(+)
MRSSRGQPWSGRCPAPKRDSQGKWRSSSVTVATAGSDKPGGGGTAAAAGPTATREMASCTVSLKDQRTGWPRRLSGSRRCWASWARSPSTRSAKRGSPARRPRFTASPRRMLRQTSAGHPASPKGCSLVSKKKMTTPSCQESTRKRSSRAMPSTALSSRGRPAAAMWPCISAGCHMAQVSSIAPTHLPVRTGAPWEGAAAQPQARRRSVRTLPRKSPRRKRPFSSTSTVPGAMHIWAIPMT